MSVLRILVSGDFGHFEERSILSYKGKQSYVMRSLVLFSPGRPQIYYVNKRYSFKVDLNDFHSEVPTNLPWCLGVNPSE